MRRVAAVAVATLLVACGPLRPGGDPPGVDADFFAEGVEALELGDFVGAEDRFRRLAARCEEGERGRRALALLAALELDPRNGGGTPQEAARLAATFLNLPGAPAEERAVARTLYLAALDRGALPVRDDSALVDPDAAGAVQATVGPIPAAYLRPARRFTGCDEGPPEWVDLPEHPGVTAAEAIRSARAEGAVSRHMTDSLQARVRALETELERIRKLLRGGGGGAGPGP